MIYKFERKLKGANQVDAEGEELTINNAGRKVQKFELSGRSEQETREGYNLLNVPSNFEITSSQNNRIVPISLKANTTYTIQADEIDTDNISTSPNFLFRLRYNNENVGNIRVLLRAKKISFTTMGNVDTVWIYSGTNYNESATTNTTFKNLMIYEGTAEKSYEPYTGGTLSPNPDYPQKIKNVGDDVNLAYISSKKDYNYSSTLEKDAVLINGTSTNAGNIVLYLNGDDGITLKANKKYIVSLFFDGHVTGKGYKQIYLQSMPIGDIASNKMVTKEIILLEDKVCKTINLDLSANCTFDNMKVKVMITENGKLKKYIPYNCIKVTICNKNIINILDATEKTINGVTYSIKNGEITLNGTTNQDLEIVLARNISLKKETYTHSCSDILAGVFISLDNIGETMLSGPNRKTIMFNLQNDKVFSKYFMYINNGTTFNNTKIKLQIEKGRTATGIVTHVEQEIIFPLTKGQKLYEGSYLAEDGIHHKRKQVILNAKTSENWYLGKTSDDTWKTDVFCLQLLNVSKINFSVTILSNYFKNKLVWSIDNEGIFLQSSNETLIVRLNKDRLEIPSSVDSFKTWLSTHNIIVEYELAQEEIIPYTPEQQEIYSQLQNLELFRGCNHITVESNVKPTIKLSYYDGELDMTDYKYNLQFKKHMQEM